MRVLHLVYNLIRGGTEGQCARVAMELARRGQHHRVMVFRREGYFLNDVEATCGPVVEVGIRHLVRPATLLAIRRLARLLTSQRYDLLHTWDADAAIFGQFAAAMAGVPLVTSRRDLGQIYPPHKVWLLARADRRSQRIVANARAIANHFAATGVPLEKFTTISNILDAEETDRLAQQPYQQRAQLPSGQRVVMVARLDPEKDVPTFIYAAELALKQHPDISFVVAGDGVERTALEQMASRHGLNGRIAFLGDITDVPSLLRQCHVGVLTPSRNEGLSNTILEYMAASLPVVATDCGGNKELVTDGRGGFVVPVGNAEKLAHAMVDLLRKPDLCRTMGSFNRRRIVTEFTRANVGDEFSNLYHDVIRQTKV